MTVNQGRSQSHSKATQDLIDGAQESSAHGASGGTSGRVAALASAVALLFSGYSLWETSLKAPSLKVYLAPVVHYTRDANGNYEVFAVPLTIANNGARDGAVLSVDLVAKEVGGKESKAFYSAYSVDGRFFVNPGRYNVASRSFERVDRPKTPFAPISIAGRSAYTGTLLFYTKGKLFPKLVHQKGTYELTVKVNAQLDDSLGVLDQFWSKAATPATVTVKLPYFSKSQLLIGGTHRMTSVSLAGVAGEKEEEAPPSDKPSTDKK